MILLSLGIIIGIAISILVAVLIVFLKHPIQQKVIQVEKAISNEGPRPKGYVLEPSDDMADAREEIIERNKKLGRDTPIEDLRV
jgi:hypothetical protein